MLSMDVYYKILNFLKSENIDRIYPVEEYFYEINETGERIPKVFTGDSFLFTTNHQSFKGIDYVEVLLEADTDYLISDLSLNFSEYVQGYSPVAVYTPDNGDSRLTPDVPTRVVFTMRKSMNMSETTRNYTNINSIELITPDNSSFKIHDICFRDNNALFNIEQLTEFYSVGINHITSLLHVDSVPDELELQIYKASAGYAWMSVWEYEARVMQDEQKNALSYGKWLLKQVDNAIDDYKEKYGIADDDVLFVKHDIVTHVPLRY